MSQRKIIIKLFYIITFILLCNNNAISEAMERMKVDNIADLKCINCQNEYSYNQDIRFKIINEGENDLYVYFAIKIKTDNGWKLLTDDLREASKQHKLPSWKLAAREVKVILWNKHVMLPPEDLKKDGVPPPSPDDPVTSYDIAKGGELMLFAWKVSPLPHGLHKEIHKFILLPKKN